RRASVRTQALPPVLTVSRQCAGQQAIPGLCRNASGPVLRPLFTIGPPRHARCDPMLAERLPLPMGDSDSRVLVAAGDKPNRPAMERHMMKRIACLLICVM